MDWFEEMQRITDIYRAGTGLQPLNAAPQHDWAGDFADENGNYMNQCCKCGNQFRGYKRRVICKACAAPAAAPVGDGVAADTGATRSTPTETEYRG